ncbi:hypothetical protein V865_002881 [Kwoniella europaea PYCC6329]|uniref:Uncharacterized protein n=1 Tax=Kwoniella europaea PYCC6329 TaxID=1423913 RepID=A0AAX4KH26_9TREE
MSTLGGFLDSNQLKIQRDQAEYTPSTRSMTATGFVRLMGFADVGQGPREAPEEHALGFWVKTNDNSLSSYNLNLPLNEKDVEDKVLEAVSELVEPWRVDVVSEAEHMSQAKLILSECLLMKRIFSPALMKRHFNSVPNESLATLNAIELLPMPQSTQLDPSDGLSILKAAEQKQLELLTKRGMLDVDFVNRNRLVSLIRALTPSALQSKSGTPDQVFLTSGKDGRKAALLLVEVKNGGPNLLSQLCKARRDAGKTRICLMESEALLDNPSANVPRRQRSDAPPPSGLSSASISEEEAGNLDVESFSKSFSISIKSELRSFDQRISCQVVEAMLAYGQQRLVLTTIYESVLCELDVASSTLSYSQAVQHYVMQGAPKPRRSSLIGTLTHKMSHSTLRDRLRPRRLPTPTRLDYGKPVTMRRFLATLLYNLSL